eukprot:m.394110 g.394110  ORF g.394110 m.394110 type:complete len:66 (+) comp21087_c1_seq50:5478-5675(+)
MAGTPVKFTVQRQHAGQCGPSVSLRHGLTNRGYTDTYSNKLLNRPFFYGDHDHIAVHVMVLLRVA